MIDIDKILSEMKNNNESIKTLVDGFIKTEVSLNDENLEKVYDIFDIGDKIHNELNTLIIYNNKFKKD